MTNAQRLLSFATAYGGYVAGLHLVDGPWKDWKKGPFVDMWTTTHVAWGVLARVWGLSFEQIAVLSVVNEMGEAWVRANRPDLLFGSLESAPNVAIDVGTTLLAYKLTPP